jgi:hypothetical protein
MKSCKHVGSRNFNRLGSWHSNSIALRSEVARAVFGAGVALTTGDDKNWRISVDLAITLASLPG